ncbi:MAG: PRC-barrel domain protein [Firmicutes bacterium ADurb.Bin193]|nr:MAG: PRC-barrel domain protein [Firmicutes bacterium ADurb.Bin193]
MEKVTKLINLPVMCENSKEKIGHISDVVFDFGKMSFAGYVVAMGSFMKPTRFLPAENVKNMDNNLIWIEDKNALTSSAFLKEQNNYKTFRRQTAGTHITKSGGVIGKISDIIYNSEEGKIAFFEVSNGFAEDVLYGRKNINVNNDIVFGNNNVEINDKGE